MAEQDKDDRNRWRRRMNTLIAENEKRFPELVELRTIALDENESEDRRGKAALYYCLIALALNRDRMKEEKKDGT